MEQPETKHNPDVLECLSNLSNDEVFTPPHVANAMLDLLPQGLFRDPKTTFLDPCCKSGVFLREIAKRLIVGLEPTFPNLQERLDHIFHKQLFGFAITELTALLSRRSLYCTKFADGEYSISHFDTSEGNILLPPTQHEWKGDRCKICGASLKALATHKEEHAYAFIHGINPEKVFNMKFDVIIGNPPYQLQDGAGGQGSSAKPLYHLFVEMGKRLAPKYMVLITPSRWFVGGKGLDQFRDAMLQDKHFTELRDFPITSMCFPGVKIEGGVSYFLWERDKTAPCHIVTAPTYNTTEERTEFLRHPGIDVFIRYIVGKSVIDKVRLKKEKSFETLVSARKPFGLDSTFRQFSATHTEDSVKIYANKRQGYVPKALVSGYQDLVDAYKVYISFAYGMGNEPPYQVLNKPFVGEPNTCCTETYLLIGPFDSEIAAENVNTYLRTRFFRFLVMMKKITQNGTAKVYEFVPMQDFHKPWTDKELYAKYGLTDEEIAFIESMVKPMEV